MVRTGAPPNAHALEQHEPKASRYHAPPSTRYSCVIATCVSVIATRRRKVLDGSAADRHPPLMAAGNPFDKALGPDPEEKAKKKKGLGTRIKEAFNRGKSEAEEKLESAKKSRDRAIAAEKEAREELAAKHKKAMQRADQNAHTPRMRAREPLVSVLKNEGVRTRDRSHGTDDGPHPGPLPWNR